MWDAVAPVTDEYDPIVYEGGSPGAVSVLNAGPGIVQMRAWFNDISAREEPEIEMTVRPGDSRLISGRLVRVRFIEGRPEFAAIAWRYLGHER